MGTSTTSEEFAARTSLRGGTTGRSGAPPVIAALLVGGFHWELADPYVGPAIRLEAGRGYVV
jgi:hypothetical protein